MLDYFKDGFLDLLTWLATGIIDSSYYICLAVCLIALFMYIGGQKKAGKYVSVSFVIYFVLQALKGAMR